MGKVILRTSKTVDLCNVKKATRISTQISMQKCMKTSALCAADSIQLFLTVYEVYVETEED